MAKRIIFIGDSLTKGECGVSYVASIQKSLPDINCINAGINGDTLLGVVGRLKHMVRDEQYDYIVIEAGINDILLPHIKDQGIIKQRYARSAAKRGSMVTPIGKFGAVLDGGLAEVRKYSKAKIIITTLSCIGENVASALNRQRNRINEQIKKIAPSHGAVVADVGRTFDAALRKRASSDYLVNSSLRLILDLAFSKDASRFDRISKRRNLYLTIDGVHLNSRGAQLYFNELIKHLVF